MFGFLNVYKPKGMTSFDVISILRKLTKIRQIGHTGTLDPFAQGVLPVSIGNCTRPIEYVKEDKSYLAACQFGKTTDTYDIEGKITGTYDKKITKEDVINAFVNEAQRRIDNHGKVGFKKDTIPSSVLKEYISDR